MRAFTQHHGIAAAILRNNIDTDAIIPSVEMKRVSRQGLAQGLFASWRYLDRDERTINPEFILNQAPFDRASILLAGENFGCGSSREHAVWALDEFGIRAIVAPSFGAIFRANCIANGLLPVVLPWTLVRAIASEVAAGQGDCELTVDLEQQLVSTPSGTQHHFQIPESDAAMLINGWDAITMTQQLDEQVHEYQTKDRKNRPWVYLPPG